MDDRIFWRAVAHVVGPLILPVILIAFAVGLASGVFPWFRPFAPPAGLIALLGVLLIQWDKKD